MKIITVMLRDIRFLQHWWFRCWSPGVLHTSIVKMKAVVSSSKTLIISILHSI